MLNSDLFLIFLVQIKRCMVNSNSNMIQDSILEITKNVTHKILIQIKYYKISNTIRINKKIQYNTNKQKNPMLL